MGAIAHHAWRDLLSYRTVVEGRKELYRRLEAFTEYDPGLFCTKTAEMARRAAKLAMRMDDSVGACMSVAIYRGDEEVVKLVLETCYAIEAGTHLEMFTLDAIKHGQKIERLSDVIAAWQALPGQPSRQAEEILFDGWLTGKDYRSAVLLVEAYQHGKTLVEQEVEEIYYRLLLDGVPERVAAESASRLKS